MKFAMLINSDEAELDRVASEEWDIAMREINGWFEKWTVAGKIADGGAHLQRTTTAKTVRLQPDGTPVVTDGPYLELKEVVCGFMLLEADDADDAVAVAATWPGLGGSSSVEVRPIFEH
jgi:hypothetical protein